MNAYDELIYAVTRMRTFQRGLKGQDCPTRELKVLTRESEDEVDRLLRELSPVISGQEELQTR
jgi:hypothetical protein